MFNILPVVYLYSVQHRSSVGATWNLSHSATLARSFRSENFDLFAFYMLYDWVSSVGSCCTCFYVETHCTLPKLDVLWRNVSCSVLHITNIFLVSVRLSFHCAQNNLCSVHEFIVLPTRWKEVAKCLKKNFHRYCYGYHQY